MISYFADLAYGATKYPCAWFRPSVYIGKFGNTESQILQRRIHSQLLRIGFQRTFWQLVFPGQTAGLIKRIAVTETGVNEYHVRFYDDGTIECELEVDRWSIQHWTGPRLHREAGRELLLSLLEQELVEWPQVLKEKACLLVGFKTFTDKCVRTQLTGAGQAGSAD